MTTRKRQGVVPDFLVHAAIEGTERPLLMELKTLHYGPSTYGADAQRCAAVGRRAAALPAEYRRKDREVNLRYCGSSPDRIGPVERKLQTYEPVRRLVFGAWAEGSPQIEKLLSALATAGATRHWRSMRCTEEQAGGSLAWLLRRRWALTVLRDNARLKLDRLEYVGRGAMAAADRRATAATAFAARQRAAAATLASGPRLHYITRRG